MKEQMTYVAIDADNVGESVGNAVLSNDTDQLSSISNSINSGIGIFSQWVEHNGGKVISSGSDEAIFQVPIQSIDELEKLKQEYQNKTGFSISIGIGENVSDAAKALIYAKMNGKDQIIDYSPEMERAMKQALSGELNENVEQEQSEEVPEHEKDLNEEQKALHDSTENMSDEEEIEQEQLAEEAAQDKKGETEEVEVPADQVDGDYGSEEMADAQPEHEKEMSEEEEFIHDAEENREDELDDDIIEADEEEEYLEEEAEEEPSEDEALEEMVEEEGAEDIDLDGRPDEQEEHGEIDPAIDDIDGDGDVEHEEAMAAEAGDEEGYSDEGDFQDEVVEEDDSEEDVELEAAISQEMGAEEIPEEAPMEEAPMEEVGTEEPLDHEDLKQVIYESLNIFRQNREYLNAMAQENPELYSSLIHTLQAMIEMAKELGYGDAVEELGAEEPSMEDETLSDEDDVMQMSEDNEEEMQDYEKSETYIHFIQKMRKAFKMLKSDDSKTIQEIREVAKKKKEQAKKGGDKKVSKKRKPSVKNPVIPGKKKKKVEEKSDSDGSFCAKSHKKMRAAGKDCRSNEDKNSPLCTARKKFNCRGKNEEKGQVMDKSEKLAKFLKKKEVEIKSGNKGRQGTGTKQTTKKVHKEHIPVGAQNLKNKVKVQDSETGKEKWIDASAGLAMGPDGSPMAAEAPSPMKGKKPRPVKMPKTDKV